MNGKDSGKIGDQSKRIHLLLASRKKFKSVRSNSIWQAHARMLDCNYAIDIRLHHDVATREAITSERSVTISASLLTAVSEAHGAGDFHRQGKCPDQVGPKTQATTRRDDCTEGGESHRNPQTSKNSIDEDGRQTGLLRAGLAIAIEARAML